MGFNEADPFMYLRGWEWPVESLSAPAGVFGGWFEGWIGGVGGGMYSFRDAQRVGIGTGVLVGVGGVDGGCRVL